MLFFQKSGLFPGHLHLAADARVCSCHHMHTATQVHGLKIFASDPHHFMVFMTAKSESTSSAVASESRNRS